jgi:hypothetical protein
MWSAPLLWLAACGEPEPAHPAPSPEPAPVSTEPTVPADLLSPRERAIRASMAVRGIRPSPGELAAIDLDPDGLATLVATWVESPEFLATMRDLHAQDLAVRTDADNDTLMPARGPFEGANQEVLADSILEEPLVLVEHIIAENRPYTEIVTADYMMADQTLAGIYGVAWDPAGPAWQESHWVDGRPHAGLLSDSQLFRRHQSAGSNFHRGRGNFVASALLCDDFGSRDVVVEGGVDLADEVAVADAVQNNPSCVGCHQALDPLAALFWGYRPLLQFKAINLAHDMDCEMSPFADEPPQADVSPIEDACYPLRHYTPANEGMWADWGLRPPAYYGTPVSRLDDLGQLIADDPRFSRCTVERFWSYLAQTDLDAMAPERVAELQAGFEESGYDAKKLVSTMVLSDDFLARSDAGVVGRPVVPLMVARPEAYARTIANLTGFTWLANPPGGDCETGCWERVDLANSDLYGFRAMAGGIDGFLVLQPTGSPTPTRALTWARLAAEAAGYVVNNDLAQPDPALRKLVGVVGPDDDEATIRAEIARLHERLLGMPADDTDLAEALAVFDAGAAESGRYQDGWKLVIALLLQDPRLVMY